MAEKENTIQPTLSEEVLSRQVDWSEAYKYYMKSRAYVDRRNLKPGAPFYAKIICKASAPYPTLPAGMPAELQLPRYQEGMSYDKNLRNLEAYIKRCFESQHRQDDNMYTSAEFINNGLRLAVNVLDAQSGHWYKDIRYINMRKGTFVLQRGIPKDENIIAGRLPKERWTRAEESIYSDYDRELACAVNIAKDSYGNQVDQSAFEHVSPVTLVPGGTFNDISGLSNKEKLEVITRKYTDLLFKFNCKASSGEIKICHPQNWNGAYYNGIASLTLLMEYALDPSTHCPVNITPEQALCLGANLDPRNVDNNASMIITRSGMSHNPSYHPVFNLGLTDFPERYPEHYSHILKSIHNASQERVLSGNSDRSWFDIKEAINNHPLSNADNLEVNKEDEINITRMIKNLASMQIASLCDKKYVQLDGCPLWKREKFSALPVLEMFARVATITKDVAQRFSLIQGRGCEVDALVQEKNKMLQDSLAAMREQKPVDLQHTASRHK